MVGMIPVIKGYIRRTWDIGLMGMKVGGKRRLCVPAHLAYGERGMGSLVAPGADLTFEIELLEVLTRDD
nr:FKBP-type peptidyl-prolyl cis-trans isomerase [Pseudomonas sp. MWU13-2100]